MSEYEGKTMPELYEAWINNWKVMKTAIEEVVGDTPMPSPREIATFMIEMPEDVFTGLFESEYASSDLVKTMDLQALVANIQTENVQILKAALAINGRT